MELFQRGDVDVPGVPGDDGDRPARLFHQDGVLHRLGSTGVGGAKRAGPEGVRSLDHHQAASGDGFPHPSSVDLLDGLGEAHRGNRGIGSRANRLDDRLEEGLGGQWVSGIVDHDDLGLLGDGLEATAD